MNHQNIERRFLKSILKREMVTKIIPPIKPKYIGRKNNSPNSITLSQKFIDAFNRTRSVEIKKKPINNNLIFLPILISLGTGS